MIGYVKHFDSNKAMSFKANDYKLLKKYTKIWERVCLDIVEQFVYWVSV